MSAKRTGECGLNLHLHHRMNLRRTGSTYGSHTSANPTRNEPMPSSVAVLADVAGTAQVPPTLRTGARRRQKKNAQPRANIATAPPSSRGLMSARNARPLNTAPVTPRPASAIGKTQHEDAISAPSPTTAPVPARSPVDGAGMGSGADDFPSSALVMDGVPLQSMTACRL